MIASCQFYAQDTSDINIILRGCLKDIYRLDSSQAQHQHKDSLIVELYRNVEHYRFSNYTQSAIIANQDSIILNNESIVDSYKQDLKKERRKTRLFQVISVAEAILLVLVII